MRDLARAEMRRMLTSDGPSSYLSAVFTSPHDRPTSIVWALVLTRELWPPYTHDTAVPTAILTLWSQSHPLALGARSRSRSPLPQDAKSRPTELLRSCCAAPPPAGPQSGLGLVVIAPGCDAEPAYPSPCPPRIAHTMTPEPVYQPVRLEGSESSWLDKL